MLLIGFHLILYFVLCALFNLISGLSEEQLLNGYTIYCQTVYDFF